MIPQSTLSPFSLPENVDCTDRVTPNSQIDKKQDQNGLHDANYNVEDEEKKSNKQQRVDDSRIRQVNKHGIADNDNMKLLKLKENSSKCKIKRKKRIRPNTIPFDNSTSSITKILSIEKNELNSYSPITEVKMRKKKKHPNKKNSKNQVNQPYPIKRRSLRGNSSMALLAQMIVSNKKVVFITGAGLSVKSGIRPFRGNDGLWAEVVWR